MEAVGFSCGLLAKFLTSFQLDEYITRKWIDSCVYFKLVV